MEITYPFAKVFIDSTNKQNIFFCHSPEHIAFEQIGDIGSGIVALLQDKHVYAHFFLIRNFYSSDCCQDEQISYANFIFQYYGEKMIKLISQETE